MDYVNERCRCTSEKLVPQYYCAKVHGTERIHHIRREKAEYGYWGVFKYLCHWYIM